MKKFALILILSFFIINTSIYLFPEEIDLVELQKKEKKRRSKLKKAKYKITNENITSVLKKKKKISFVKVDNESTGEEPEKEKKVTKVPKEDPKKKEEYWRRKMMIANANINTCRSNIEKTQSNLNQAQTNFLIADIPLRINQSRVLVEKLSKALADLKTNLVKFEQDKEELYNDARRAGAPPGWLR